MRGVGCLRLWARRLVDRVTKVSKVTKVTKVTKHSINLTEVIEGSKL